ncbi:MAG: DUF3843 family protein [Bacteroidales bacterium]
MAIQKGIITMNEWMRIHPYRKSGSIDHEYLNLAKKIYNTLLNYEDLKAMEQDVMKQLSLTLTAYLEDIISDYGMWNAFRNLHKRMYDKWLPFYEVNKKEYVFDEINRVDVMLLSWMVVQRLEDERKTIHPEGVLVNLLTNIIYPLLDEAFELLPINEQLHWIFRDPNIYTNFHTFRAANSCLFLSSYLFLNFGHEYAKQVENQAVENDFEDKYIYSLIENCPFLIKMPPLTLFSHEYLAEMIADLKKENKWVSHVSYIESSVFEYNGRKKNNYLLTDLKTRIRYEVHLDSCSLDANTPIGATMLTQLVNYQGKWLINGGVVFFVENKEEVINDVLLERNTIKHNNMLYDAFMKVNKKSPIVFTSCYHDAKEIMKQYYKVNDLPEYPSEFRNQENYVLYADRDKGMEIAMNIAAYIKHKNNPIYDKKEAAENALCIVRDRYSCPREMSKYLIENKMVPDAMLNPIYGKNRATALVQDNIRFLSNFMLGD